MGHPVCLALVITSTAYVCHALPLSEDELAGNALKPNLVYLIGTTIAFLICVISLLVICACWGNKKRLKLHTISSQIELQNQSVEPGIFASSLSPQLSTSDSKIYFEPLPDITPRAAVKKVSVSLTQSKNWFAEPYQNFPRNQLQYIRKIGSGWFGQVLEGRAVGVDTDHTSTAISKLKSEVDCNTVAVKCLREDATTDEQSYFLQELLPYKKLHHSNLMRVLSFCLETQPFLILLEYCAKGDLKSVLKNEAFSDVYLLRMADGVTEGLWHMHTHDFVHTDLAARNCLVTQDNTIKIGDYGNSIEAYKNEYYLAERIALPLRWCAPESLNCSDTTIETVELTKAANVWSFGVLLWEILSRARLPYQELGNDEVIQRVILEGSIRLESPFETVHQDEINGILEACFAPCDVRIDVESIGSMLKRISGPKPTDEDEFEKRWNQLTSPSKSSPSVEALCSFNSASASPSSGGWLPSSVEGSTVAQSNESASCQTPFSPVLPVLPPPEDPYDSMAPIAAAIKTLDESLAARDTEANLSTSRDDVHFADIVVDSSYEADKWSAAPLTESEEDFLTKRLEQGDFSELVRVKSQSVQDLMRLTVIDYSSDSSERASQPGSLLGDPSSLVSEKCFCSEGNLREAARDDGFMVELERLQVEHRYSIISEVSREDASMEQREPLEDFADPPHRLLHDRQSLSTAESHLHNEQLSPCDPSRSKPHLCHNNAGNVFSPISSPLRLNTATTTVDVGCDADDFQYFTAISDGNRHNNTAGYEDASVSDRNHNHREGGELRQKENDSREDGPSNGGGTDEPMSETDPTSGDGGHFWKLQMAAWQEAAQETRELLHEAASSSSGGVAKLDDVEAEGFQSDPFDSPHKHSETSEEDSETYISFDTPKDDTMYPDEGEDNPAFCCDQINPADIMALRTELRLTLNTSTDVSTDSEEQEEIFINYRSGPVSLSPIKEESLLGECDDSLSDTDISADEDEFVDRDRIQDGALGDSSGQGVDGDESPNKYLRSGVCEPLEPDSGYANLSARGPHYQSYFNTGVSNVIQCGASLEDGSIYDSTEHTSLPYEVNFPDKFAVGNGALSSDTWSHTMASNNNELNEALRSLDNEDEDSRGEMLTPLVTASQHKNTEEPSHQNGAKEINYLDLQPLPAGASEEPACVTEDSGRCDSSDRESDIESSSTSGEFVWMGNELSTNPNYSGRSPAEGSPKMLAECDRMQADGNSKWTSDCSADDSDSGEEEFTPSMWNSKLIPNHSLLKRAGINATAKKSVHWKQQKHHRVYEYPPEPVTWHAEETQQRRTWGGHNLDYLTLADWELAEEFSVEDPDQFEQFSCTNHTNSVPSIYNIAPLPYQNDDSMVVDDCDFLIRPGAPFSLNKSAFHAHEYVQQDTSPETGAPTISGSQEASGSIAGSVGEMRYSKDNLRLNLPPILGAGFHTDILDNQRSDDQVLNNDACSNFPQ